MKALLAKLQLFQKEVEPIDKSANNPFFKSKYASLDAIQKHIKPVLVKVWLVITQCVNTGPEWTKVVTTVWDDKSGESLASEFPVVVSKSTAQEYGSAVSYAKRYSLAWLLNLIIGDEDDDGNTASGNSSQPQSKQLARLENKDLLNKKVLGSPRAEQKQEAPKKEKLELLPDTPTFDKAREFIKQGGDIEKIKKAYIISEETLWLLLNNWKKSPSKSTTPDKTVSDWAKSESKPANSTESSSS